MFLSAVWTHDGTHSLQRTKRSKGGGAHANENALSSNIWFNVIASNSLDARLVAVRRERAFTKKSQSPNNLQGSKRWFKKRRVLCLHRVGLHFKAPKLVFYIKLEIYTHK